MKRFRRRPLLPMQFVRALPAGLAHALEQTEADRVSLHVNELDYLQAQLGLHLRWETVRSQQVTQ